MLRAPRVRATLLACAFGASSSACASIWGFETGTEQSESGVDAAAPPSEAEIDSQADGDADATLSPDMFHDSRSDGLDADSAAEGADSPAEAHRDSALDAPADGVPDSPLDAALDAVSDVVADAGRATDAGADSNQGNEAGCTASCVPGVPPNWGGPYTIYEGTGGPPPPTPPNCTGSYPNAIYDGTGAPNAPAANCSCTCGAPTNATCLPPVANYFTDNGCTMPCGQANQPITATCTNLDPCSFGLLTFSGPIPSGGSCAPDAGSAIPPAGWTADVRLCGAANAPTSSGCDAGQVCVPPAAFPLEAATYCIAQSGSVPCPTGYPAARTYYQSSTDTRACSPCSCGAPTGVTCAAGSIVVYSAQACGGLFAAYSAPQSCVNTGAASAFLYSSPSPTGGMCAPTGGAAIGSFAPTTPTTICCTR